MIEKPATFRALIDDLGGFVSLGTAMNLPPNTVKGMRLRNSVAVEHWPALIAVARAQGTILTTDDLVNMKLRQIAEGEAA
jgi:hypothetical protein